MTLVFQRLEDLSLMCCELGYNTVCPLVVAHDNFIKWLHIVGLNNESRAGYAVERKRGTFFLSSPLVNLCTQLGLQLPGFFVFKQKHLGGI